MQILALKMITDAFDQGISPSSPCVLEHRRIGPQHEDRDGTTDNPWLNARNTILAGASARTDWNHVKYIPEKALQTTCRSLSDRARDPGVAFIEENLIKAIKEAISMYSQSLDRCSSLGNRPARHEFCVRKKPL